MSDYIKREDALNDAETINPKYSDLISQIKNIINAQPPADVVEVVRCKECKYWREDRTNDEYFPEVHECTYPLDGDTIWTFESEYCSNGERKDGEDE